MKTDTKKNSSTMYEKLDKIVDKLNYLSSDVDDGTITVRNILDKIDKIATDIEKIQDSL